MCAPALWRSHMCQRGHLHPPPPARLPPKPRKIIFQNIPYKIILLKKKIIKICFSFNKITKYISIIKYFTKYILLKLYFYHKNYKNILNFTNNYKIMFYPKILSHSNFESGSATVYMFTFGFVFWNNYVGSSKFCVL